MYNDYYGYNGLNTSGADNGALAGLGAILGGFLFILILFVIACIVITVIGRWKVFKKAGKEGWEAIIPIYNTIVTFELIGLNWYYIFVFCVALVPVIGQVASLIVLAFNIYYNIKLAKSFGKSVGYGVGLALVPVVFLPMLGFGDAKYEGPCVKGDIDFHDLT